MPEKNKRQNSDSHQDKSSKEIFVEILSRRLEELIVEYDLFFRQEIKIPPEKKRQDLEKSIRQLLSQEDRSGRVKLLIENLSHRFNLYNNMWQKRVSSFELGISSEKRKVIPDALKQNSYQPEPSKKELSQQEQNLLQSKISLEDPNSLENLYQNYSKFLTNKKLQPIKKELFVENITRKLKIAKIKEAEIIIKFENDNLKFKIKTPGT